MSDAPPPAVRLRPLRLGDLERVLELEVELFGPGAWSRGVYVEELTLAPGRTYLVAVDAAGSPATKDPADAPLVGYAGLAVGDEAQVMTIGVAATHRRRGIGRLLLDGLLDAAREQGARTVLLEVRAADDGAQRLYARAGFRPIGRRRRYYPDGQDAVVMRAALHRGPGPVGTEAVT